LIENDLESQSYIIDYINYVQSFLM